MLVHASRYAATRSGALLSLESAPLRVAAYRTNQLCAYTQQRGSVPENQTHWHAEAPLAQLHNLPAPHRPPSLTLRLTPEGGQPSDLAPVRKRYCGPAVRKSRLTRRERHPPVR